MQGIVIPYSGKFSRSNIFADFAVIPTFAKFLIREILALVMYIHTMSGSGNTYTLGPCTIVLVC